MLSARRTLLNWGWLAGGCFVLTTRESLKLSKEKGESWRWASSLIHTELLLLLLLLLLRLSSSTRTQWDSSLQRTYGGRLADATNSNFERRDSFLENSAILFARLSLCWTKREERWQLSMLWLSGTRGKWKHLFAFEVKWKPVDYRRPLSQNKRNTSFLSTYSFRWQKLQKFGTSVWFN